MTNALLTYTTCNDIFRSRYDLSNHVRLEHQPLVKVKFQNGSVTEVKLGEDGTFKCECGKDFKFPSSFKRHVKGCSGQLIESNKGREEDMQMSGEGSDASDSAEYHDEEEIKDSLPDCFRALCCHEMG